MLYYNFNNYDGFKSLFGMNYHANGTKSRRNKILLAFIKSKELLHSAVETNDFSLLNISSMAELKTTVLNLIHESAAMDSKLCHTLNLNGQVWRSSKYQTDSANGICEDGDIKSIRYQNMSTSRIYKMRAGKLMRQLILDTAFGRERVPEQVLVWLCEEYASEWEAYSFGKIPKNKLVVDKNFEKIYSWDAIDGDFHSCMCGRGFHTFYKDAVDASAAYLLNEQGKIIARAVIYNKCIDQNGRIWRLCERQYSTECNDTLKKALVLALIKEDKIDGYKQIGADCHSSRSFVSNNGDSLSDFKFQISCNLGTEDPLSYQDSFKWYDYDKRVAYNFEPTTRWDYMLDTTEGAIYPEDEDEYDDYHDRYCRSTELVHYHGREFYCDSDDLDEFVYIDEMGYYHQDDVETCPHCHEAYVEDEGYYSELLDKTYCCDECRSAEELKYKKANWFWSEYDQEYYEDKFDLTTLLQYNDVEKVYKPISISKESLNGIIHYVFAGQIYDCISGETNLPYGFTLSKIA